MASRQPVEFINNYLTSEIPVTIKKWLQVDNHKLMAGITMLDIGYS